MPTTIATSFSNTVPAGHSTTMTQVANSQPRNVEALVEMLDYMDTPLARLIKKDSKTGDNVKQEWTDEVHPPVTLGLAEDLDTTETGVDVTTGQGVRLQVYNLIQIDDEIMWVSAMASADTATVTRGDNIGSTSASHTTGATIYIIGTATPEKVDAVASAVTRGDSYYNYFQILQKAIEVSERQNNAGNYLIKGQEYSFEQARKYKEMWRDLEINAWRGKKFAGSASLPSTMGGVPSFITQHVTDFSGQAFGVSDLMALISAQWSDVGPENIAKLILANQVPRRAISSFYKTQQNVLLTPQDRKISLVVKTIETELGNFDLADPSFHCPPNLLVIIDPSNYKWRNFAGYGELHEGTLPAGGSYLKGMFTCDKTIIAMGDRASGKMTNLSTTVTDYPDLN